MSDVVEPTVIEEQQAQMQEPVSEPALVDAAVVKQQKRGLKPGPQVSHVVSGNATDDVYLDRCVYENKYARKSLTVHHVQRRLVELGYNDAGSDKDGWYSELTMAAVSAFQKDRSLAGDGGMTFETFVALFAGDLNVTINA